MRSILHHKIYQMMEGNEFFTDILQEKIFADLVSFYVESGQSGIELLNRRSNND